MTTTMYLQDEDRIISNAKTDDDGDVRLHFSADGAHSVFVTMNPRQFAAFAAQVESLRDSLLAATMAGEMAKEGK